MQSVAMYVLIAGLVLFFGIHLLPSAVSLRARLMDRLGANRYKGIYALVAAAGLTLIIVGKAYAPFEPVYAPPAWGRHVAHVLMLPSLILFAGANMPTNIKRFIRHPMLWGTVLWSGSHLLANGDRASLYLFGCFLAFALFDMLSANKRGAALSHTKYPLKGEIKTVAAGVVAYLVFGFLHPFMFKVAAFV